MLMTEARKHNGNIERLYTLKQVKDLLQIGFGRIQDLIEEGTLEAYSLDADGIDSRALRIPESSIMEYLQARKIGMENGDDLNDTAGTTIH